MAPDWRNDLRRIATLAWPVFVGQLAVLAFGTVDTVLVARSSATDLAALAVGSAAYVTTFIGLMGTVMAISPLAGQAFGARKLRLAGHQMHQAVWLALGLSLLGAASLVWPQLFLTLSQVDEAVAPRVRGYLGALALALPAALLFGAFRGFNNAVSRPKAVMALQLSALALKVPLSMALAWGVPALGLPALGIVGCGLATAIAMWAQVLAACWLLRRDPFYAPFETPLARGVGLHRPDRKVLGAQLRLGVPMGLSIMVEVTGFSFMAIFIARLGATPAAGHQLVSNLVALLFMLPLALANASSTLVSQRVGARDLADARRLGWRGLQLALALALALGGTVFALRGEVLSLYTHDTSVLAAAGPLVAWVLAFHVADALQIVAAFVLRAWRVATLPVVISAASVWGVGIGGGYLLAFHPSPWVPAALRGAPGFWAAATAGLALASLGLCALLAWVLRRRAAEEQALSGL